MPQLQAQAVITSGAKVSISLTSNLLLLLHILLLSVGTIWVMKKRHGKEKASYSLSCCPFSSIHHSPLSLDAGCESLSMNKTCLHTHTQTHECTRTNTQQTQANTHTNKHKHTHRPTPASKRTHTHTHTQALFSQVSGRITVRSAALKGCKLQAKGLLSGMCFWLPPAKSLTTRLNQ